MAKVEDLANELVLAKEQLMNINNTINRDRGVLEDLKKEIKQTEELKKLAEDKLQELTDEVESLYATKKSAEKEYWEVRDNLKAEIKKLSDSKKKDEEKYHISISELSNDVKVLEARKESLDKAIADNNKALDEQLKKIEAEIWVKEADCKKVDDKLNEYNVKFAEQKGKYDKVANEIKAMEERLEEKAKIEKSIAKLAKQQEEEFARVQELMMDKWDLMEEISSAKSELKDLNKQKEAVEKEVADYVKKKIDIKNRNDALDAKEKYLRKKFEEAWVKFD